MIYTAWSPAVIWRQSIQVGLCTLDVMWPIPNSMLWLCEILIQLSSCLLQSLTWSKFLICSFTLVLQNEISLQYLYQIENLSRVMNTMLKFQIIPPPQLMWKTTENLIIAFSTQKKKKKTSYKNSPKA